MSERRGIRYLPQSTSDDGEASTADLVETEDNDENRGVHLGGEWKWLLFLVSHLFHISFPSAFRLLFHFCLLICLCVCFCSFFLNLYILILVLFHVLILVLELVLYVILNFFVLLFFFLMIFFVLPRSLVFFKFCFALLVLVRIFVVIVLYALPV